MKYYNDDDEWVCLANFYSAEDGHFFAKKNPDGSSRWSRMDYGFADWTKAFRCPTGWLFVGEKAST